MSREGVGFLNGENAEARNAMLAKQLEIQKAELARPEKERRADPTPPGNMHAPLHDSAVSAMVIRV